MLVPVKAPLPLIEAVCATLNSPNTVVAYRRCLRNFTDWLIAQGNPVLTRQVVQEYKNHLVDGGAGSSSVNLALSAIRKLCDEASQSGWITEATALSIAKVDGVPQRGRRLGNWLGLEATKALIAAPDTTTVSGKRDACLLAVMIGGGLRRSEAASLTIGHLQARDGRWLLADVVGKGNRTRSIVLPQWAVERVQAWIESAGLTSGKLLRSVEGDYVGESLTGDGIAWIIKRYAKRCNVSLACHDLRRTAATLAKRGGADWEQIRDFLGHSTTAVSERYIKSALITDNPATDKMGLG